MTAGEFKEHMVSLGITNREFGRYVGKTATTVSAWKSGRLAVPTYVEVILANLLDKQKAGKLSVCDFCSRKGRKSQ